MTDGNPMLRDGKTGDWYVVLDRLRPTWTWPIDTVVIGSVPLLATRELFGRLS